MSEQDRLQQIFSEAAIDKKKFYKLLNIGREKGFGTFVNRKQIWPLLLQVDIKQIAKKPVFDWKDGNYRNSRDFDQIQKDAQRSLSSMKTFEGITKFHLKKRQEGVLQVLDVFFAKNPQLRYIQGFHDIASMYLILFGNSTGYYMVQKVGHTYFRDFLKLEFSEVSKTVSKIVYDLIVSVDAEFKQIYSSFQITHHLIFIISWVLTWFSHNFSNAKTICRIWDYLLCTGPLAIFYFTAGVLISTKNQMLESCQELDDPNIQTFYQQKTRKQSIDIEKAIRVAIELQNQVDIQNLQGYRQLNPDSMFRYSNFVKQIDFHKSYEQQRRNQLKNKKMMKYIKIGTTVLAVVVIGFTAASFIKQGKIRGNTTDL